jgi:hypothetical protein
VRLRCRHRSHSRCEAAITHYRTASFDTERYLDKLFDLRINLPSVNTGSLDRLLRHLLAQPSSLSTTSDSFASVIEAGLSIRTEALLEAATRILYLPDLVNPRLVSCLVARLHLWAVGRQGLSEPVDLTTADELAAAVRWLAVDIRWPAVRSVLQSSGSTWRANLQLLQEGRIENPETLRGSARRAGNP